MLTQAMRNGDFSAVRLHQLYDAQNGFTPFVGNKGRSRSAIPWRNFFLPTLPLYPLPNADLPTDGIINNDLHGSAAHLSREQSG